MGTFWLPLGNRRTDILGLFKMSLCAGQSLTAGPIAVQILSFRIRLDLTDTASNLPYSLAL